MKTSPAGIEFIAAWEAFSPRAYKDSAGVWTIGYGHTRGVKEGDTLTREGALTLLAMDVAEAEKAVTSLRITLEQHEWDALVSLAFNAGGSAVKGTIHGYLLARDAKAAGNFFTRYHYAGGEPLVGLFKRRMAERRLFLQGVYDAAH